MKESHFDSFMHMKHTCTFTSFIWMKPRGYSMSDETHPASICPNWLIGSIV